MFKVSFELVTYFIMSITCKNGEAQLRLRFTQGSDIYGCGLSFIDLSSLESKVELKAIL